MIEITDYDLPITVADKLIKGTKPRSKNVVDKVVDSNSFTSIHSQTKVLDLDTVDMFTLEEINEIASYLLVYCNSHKNGD